MTLTRGLADALVREHPERAASVLERHDLAQVTGVLARGKPGDAADVLRRLSPQRAGAVATLLPRGRSAALLAGLALDDAVRLVRRLEPEVREEMLAQVEPRRARAIRALIGFPEATAGALMDPEVLALRSDLSARAALAQVRAQPEHAHYNLYVVDGEQRLVGALNLRELLIARPSRTLAELMVGRPLSLPATADRARVVSHPGWKEVHSLPVVDEAGRYLGAIRYRTLRSLEQDLLAKRAGDTPAADALGQLFAAGAAGLLEALAGTGSAGGGRRGR
jgi:magnesium transporter